MVQIQLAKSVKLLSNGMCPLQCHPNIPKQGENSPFKFGSVVYTPTVFLELRTFLQTIMMQRGLSTTRQGKVQYSASNNYKYLVIKKQDMHINSMGKLWKVC